MKVPPVLREGLYWLAARAGNAIGTAHNRALARYELELRSFAVLAMVGEGVAKSQLEIAQAVGLDKTTLVSTLDDLERRALVARRADPTDRRARIVEITSGGAALLKEAAASICETERSLLADMSDADLAIVKSTLLGLLRGPLHAYLDRAGSCL